MHSGYLAVPANTNMRVLIALLGVLAILAAAGSRGGPAEAATRCSGKQVSPSQNLSSVAAAAAAGTTFCVKDGTYTVSSPIVVEKGDKFIGVYTDRSRPVVRTTQAQHIFSTKGADNSRIEGLTVTGAVGNDACEPNCGRGIGGGGSNVVIEDVRATRNANQGIGAMGPGLVVRRSLLDNNGSPTFTDPQGPRSAAGIKTINSFTVENSVIRDNNWNGIWCDVECDTMVVRNNTIVNNDKSGITYEISSGPSSSISGNTIYGNGQVDTFSREAEIIVGSSDNISVSGNTFGPTANDAVLVYAETAADRDPGTPGMHGVSVSNNTLNGDTLKGCTLAGVTCSANR